MLFRVLILLSILLPLSTAYGNCTVTLSVSGIYPPFNQQSHDGKWFGLTVDLAKEVITRAGCDVHLVNTPWYRTMKLLREGQIDVLPLASKTSERKEFSRFIGPIYVEQTVFVTNRPYSSTMSQDTPIEEFPGRIGKTRGTAYAPELEKAFSHPDIQSRTYFVTSDANKMEMLKKNRFDAVFEETAVIDFLFNSGVLNPQEYSVVKRFKLNPVYLSISKASVSLEQFEQLNQSWKLMQQQNIVAAIYKKYGVKLPEMVDISH